MKLIQLPNVSQKPIYVNIDQVISIESLSNATCIIRFSFPLVTSGGSWPYFVEIGLPAEECVKRINDSNKD